MSAKLTPLKRLKLLGDAAFLKRGYPSKKDENFRYFPISKFLKSGFLEESTLQEICKKELTSVPSDVDTIHFVNGQFNSYLMKQKEIENTVTNKPLIVLDEEKALASYGPLIMNRVQKEMQSEKDPFVLLNLKEHQNGVFIFVPPNTESNISFHFTMKDLEEKKSLYPRIQIFVSKGAKFHFTSTYDVQTDTPFCINECFDITLEKNSVVTERADFSVPQESYVFAARRVAVQESASYAATVSANNGEAIRFDAECKLLGKFAKADVKGAFQLRNKMSSHTNLHLVHLAENTVSNQHFKNVLFDNAKANFAGKITIDQSAQKSEAYQLNNSLVIDEGASCTAKPNLEIYADDVKASHGATVGMLDEEQMFYMMARGIKKAMAKKILIDGFLQEILGR